MVYTQPIYRSQLPKECKRLSSLYAKQYGPKAAEFYEARVVWQFGETPGSSEDDPAILVRWIGDLAVGHLGVLSGRLSIMGGEAPLSWAEEFFILPEYRGSGHGLAIWGEWLARHPLAAVLGATDPTVAISRKTGFQVVVRLPLHILSLGQSPTARLTNFVNAVILQRAGTSEILPAYTVVSDASISKRLLAELWSRYRSTARCMQVRDYEFFCWRFLNHPYKRYRNVLVLKDDIAVGYAIFRLVRHRGGVTNYAYLVDLFGDLNDEAFIQTVVAALIQYSRRQFVVQVSALATMPRICRVLEKFGFVPSLERGPDFLLKVTGSAHNGVLQDVTLWHLTMADSDLEIVAP